MNGTGKGRRPATGGGGGSRSADGGAGTGRRGEAGACDHGGRAARLRWVPRHRQAGPQRRGQPRRLLRLPGPPRPLRPRAARLLPAPRLPRSGAPAASDLAPRRLVLPSRAHWVSTTGSLESATAKGIHPRRSAYYFACGIPCSEL